MATWRYEPARDLDQTVMERLRRFPREPDMLVYGLRSAVALALRTWLKAYHRLEITGREHLPAEGSFVMVANHSSHLDALCLLAALPLRKLHRAFPAAAADYFFVDLPRIAAAAIVVNALPFAREVGARQSLALCRQLLASPGNILLLFPEGSRTTTGEIGEFKPGIGLLLAGSSVPVVPCHLAGAFAAWPKGSAIPQPRRVRVRIGAPRRFDHLAVDKESMLRVARELQTAVEELANESH
jgi:1-acyl-sn-glycerol-3-phosphate acyltransferase